MRGGELKVVFFINILATIISGCIIAMFMHWLRNRGEKQ